jgi:hypothetical protein
MMFKQLFVAPVHGQIGLNAGGFAMDKRKLTPGLTGTIRM